MSGLLDGMIDMPAPDSENSVEVVKPSSVDEAETTARTYRIAYETIDGLELARLRLRKQLKRSISYSEIVDAAVQRFLSDYDHRKAISEQPDIFEYFEE